jgi:hypothetical protein
VNIACLGWGSLIWNPGNLLNRREWFLDGPMLGIEFARESSDRRLTLVITNDAMPVRTLWTLMATADLEVAKQSLRVREGISNINFETYIGSYTVDKAPTTELEKTLQQWGAANQIDAVIWTNLPPKFGRENNKVPSIEDAINHLRSLDINAKSNAENYVRRAPRQIDTEYRRRFEQEFGWTFIS